MKSFKNILSLVIIIATGVIGYFVARSANTAVAMIDPTLLVISFPATIILGAAAISIEVKILNKINMLNINFNHLK